MTIINSFKGKFSFLSNFSTCYILYNGKVYKTAEHLYQAMKTFDEHEQEMIRLADTPGKAKRLGRRTKLRTDWENSKERIMLAVLRLKFEQNQQLALKLKQTGECMIVEGNYWHDNIWGDCYCGKCTNIKGENLLGKLLMRVRRELKDNE